MKDPYPSTHPEECIFFKGRLVPHEIAFVNALLDDLEGVVVVRTEEPVEGRMEYWVAPDLVEEFKVFFFAVRDATGIDMTLEGPVPESSEIPHDRCNHP